MYFIDRNSDLKVQTAIDFLILVILVQELPNADLRNARGNVCNPVWVQCNNRGWIKSEDKKLDWEVVELQIKFSQV